MNNESQVQSSKNFNQQENQLLVSLAEAVCPLQSEYQNCMEALKPKDGGCLVFDPPIKTEVLSPRLAATRIGAAIDEAVANRPWANVDNGADAKLAKEIADYLLNDNTRGLGELAVRLQNEPQRMMRLVNHLNDALDRAGVRNLDVSYSATTHSRGNPTTELLVRYWHGSPTSLTGLHVNTSTDRDFASVSASYCHHLGSAANIDSNHAAKSISTAMRTIQVNPRVNRVP